MVVFAGMSLFNVYFNHGGGYIDDSSEYYGGVVHAEYGCDIDRWSYYEAISILRYLGYSTVTSVLRLFWKTGDEYSEDGLREMKNDRDAIAFANQAIANNGEGDLYVTEVKNRDTGEVVQREPSLSLPFTDTATIISRLVGRLAESCGVNDPSTGGSGSGATGGVNEDADADVIYIGEGWVGGDITDCNGGEEVTVNGGGGSGGDWQWWRG